MSTKLSLAMTLVSKSPFDQSTDMAIEDAMDPLASYDLFISSTFSADISKSKIDYYLEEAVLPRTHNFDILVWWKTNGIKYPILQRVARDILAIHTVVSEFVFSIGGKYVSPHHNRLHPKILKALICSQDWLWTKMRSKNIYIFI